MRAHERRTVLVPIFDGDITDDALTAATTLLAEPDRQLVLVHVTPTSGGATSACPTCGVEPRWHRLASAIAPDHTFIEAVAGDPVDEVLAEAQRFDSDAIVLGQPASSAPCDAWIHETIEQLARAAPSQVCLASRREHPRRLHAAAAVARRVSSPNWRSHAT